MHEKPKKNIIKAYLHIDEHAVHAVLNLADTTSLLKMLMICY